MSAVMEACEPSAKHLSALQPPLVQQFDLLATAPGGVAKLRELVLTLAVQGKLVPQDPKDEPASVLLKNIQAQKERLFAIGALKKEKRTASQIVEDLQAVLPRGWEACRLSQLILSIRSGGTPSKQNSDYWDGDIPWASVKDLRFGEPISDTQDKITKAGLDAGSELAPAGSILICTRMGLGKIGEALVDIAINQDLKAVQLGIGVNKQYFINYFKTLPMVGSGMTVAGIKQDELLSFVVPLPPAAEQARIVTRVEEFMRLCDALEAKGQLEAAQHAQLVQTLLGALTASTSPDELAENWQRVATHFDRLLDRPEAIDALEQTILQLAVRGLLVPQDTATTQRNHGESGPHDICTEKIGAGERPFDVPQNWRWVRLGSIAELINGDRGTNYPNKAEYVSAGLPFINTGHIEPDGTLSNATMNFLTRAKFDSLRSGKTKPGDLVYCLRGATLGKTAVVDYPEGAIASSLVIIRPNEVLDRGYAYLYLTSPLGRSLIRRFDNGSAQPNLSAASVRKYVVPLPPSEEQRRIVARVESLRRLCTDLRQRLAARQTTQAHLAEALIDDMA